jgi:cyanate permease
VAGPAADTEKAATTRWAVVLTAVGAGMLLGAQVGKAPPMIAAIRADLGLDLVAAGFFMSLINGVAVATGILAGVFADNAGRRRAVLLALAVLLAGNVLGATAAGAPQIFASRLCEAFSFVVIAVAAPGLILEATAPRDVRMALSVWSTYMPAGFAAMMAAAPFIAAPEHWRTVWWFNAGLTVIYAAVFLTMTRGLGRRPMGTGRLRGLAEVVRRPGPWLMGVAFMLYTVQWFGVLTWLPTILQGVGLSAAAAGAGVAVVVAANIPGNLAAGVLLSRGAARWKIIAACSLALGLLTLGIYDSGLDPVFRLVLAGLFSAIGGAIPGAVLAGAATHSPSPAQVGITNGVIVQCTNLGSLLGPPAVAWMAAMAGGDFTAARWLTLAAGVAGVAVALALRGVERRLGEAPAAAPC